MRPILLAFAGIIAFFVLSTLVGKDCQRIADRSFAKDALRERALKALVAPSTADVREVRILEQAGRKILGYVELDAKNEFGVALRNRWCIVVELDIGRDSFYFGPADTIMPCDGDSLTPAVLAAVKGLNHWDEPEYWERSARAAAAAK